MMKKGPRAFCGPARGTEGAVSRSLTRLQALFLGTILLLGMGLAGLGLFAVGSRGWFGKDALHVRVGFREIRGVEVGTRVRIQGMDAGEVVAIAPPEEPDSPVVLRLRLRGDFRRLVRTDSTVQIVSEGMIGGKVLEIHGGPRKSGVPSEAAGDDVLLTGEPGRELNDVLGQVDSAIKDVQGALEDIRKGEGTLGKLAHDPKAYDALVALLAQGRDTLGAIQQDAEAVKRLPLVNRYVEDPTALLVRPNCERNCQWFAEADLFEPGRAVLTARGRQRLDELAPWLEGMKHKGSEVVVVACADPHGSVPSSVATALTRQQSEAVCEYLKDRHSIQKLGWFSSRKVTPLGLGVVPPPLPEHDPLPPARVEVLVFVPQG
jgi:phospholipid/cholesterol/gamma-HCH transport system substrate-binding protein